MIVSAILSLFAGDKPVTPGKIMQNYFAFDAEPPKPKTPAEIDHELLSWAEGFARRKARRKKERGTT